MTRKSPTKTTTSTRTTRKTAPARPAAAKAVAKTPAVRARPAPATLKVLGKRELIDRVVDASGIKKRAAKPVIESVLKELGDAFSRGDTLNLQPFGKGIVKAHKDLENAEVIEVRIRRSKTALRAFNQPSDPLAEAAE
ncbi:MAG: HU family DNA-binding protein [Pseudomonadota bacterium]